MNRWMLLAALAVVLIPPALIAWAWFRFPDDLMDDGWDDWDDGLDDD